MKFLAILFGVLFSIWLCIITIFSIQFDRNCGGYLKRAADANTVELAKKELYKSYQYMLRNNLTEGYTSIIYNTPDEDIGFWFKNIESSYRELENIPDKASQLEKTNVLMKLRETLLDKVEKGESITVPKGISRYPYNGMLSFTGWTLFLCFVGSVIGCFIRD